MSGGKVDFGLLRENSKEILLTALQKIRGHKIIIWEKPLAGLFSLIANVSVLRENQVQNMYYISGQKADTGSVSNIIFLTSPTLASMDHINSQIRAESNNKTMRKDFYLWCVPRITSLCIDHLKHHGIYETFNDIEEMPIYTYRFENDLISLELPNCYKDIHLYRDPTSLYYIARAIMTIQGLYGIIPNVFGKGNAATEVFNMIVRMRMELAGNEPQMPPQIDQMILIDRNIDLVSPLATQLTYEGLIDQFFGINNCIVKLPIEKFNQAETDSQQSFEQSVGQKEKSVQLTSSETLFSELRDCNFSSVGAKLSSEAKQISAQLEQRHDAKTIQSMKQFVQKLPQVQVARQSLETHTAIAELIQEHIANPSFRLCLETEQELLRGFETDRVNPTIEDSIAQKEPLEKVIQLICLQNSVNCGLKQKVFDFYKREILQTYGFEHILMLENLEKVGLIYVQQSKSTYSAIRKTLRLTVDDVNELSPTDVSYVHSGYAPLSVRLAEFLQLSGWRAIVEALNLMPGPTLTEIQQLPSSLRQRRNSASSLNNGQGDSATSLVVFIGGCTYSEVAGLRFLSSKIDQGGPEYVIMTTKLINPTSFIESISEKLI